MLGQAKTLRNTTAFNVFVFITKVFIGTHTISWLSINVTLLNETFTDFQEEWLHYRFIHDLVLTTVKWNGTDCKCKHDKAFFWFFVVQIVNLCIWLQQWEVLAIGLDYLVDLAVFQPESLFANDSDHKIKCLYLTNLKRRLTWFEKIRNPPGM